MLRFRRVPPYVYALLSCAVLIVLRVFGIFSNTPVGASAEERQVRVTYILDGDTVETAHGERIRLLGIDAPEVAHHDVKGDPYGKESAGWLSHRLLNKTVNLAFGPELTDRYGRTLAWIYEHSDGGVPVLINEAALRTGNAALLDRFGLPKELEPQLRAAEAEAKSNKLGIWK